MLRTPSQQTAIQYILIGIVLLFVLFPFFWMASSSFKTMAEIMSSHPTLLPEKPTLRNYHAVLRARPGIRDFPRYMTNSFIVSLGTALLGVFIGLLGGYGLARYRFPGQQIFARMMLFIYVFPVILLLVPVYKIVSDLGLLDQLWSLMIVYTAFVAPFLAWLLTAFIESIPADLEEAALVDGASRAQAFLRVTLPLAAPGIVTAAVFAFITAWGEYVFALILITSGEKRTAPLGLATFMTEQYIEWGPLVAAAVLVIIPVTVLFFPLAKYFIRGFMAGAVKQ